MNDTYDIGKAFQAIEDELIASMIRNMRRHKLEEIKEDKQWTMWQAVQLKALEKYKKANQKKYGKQFKDINAQIEQLIRIAKEDGNMQQELAILNAIKKGFPAKRISKGATAEFFKLNERKLEALIKATTDDMKKAEIAILRRANDQYRKAIYNAQVYANTGAGTYEKAVDMATKDMIASGLACVEYANGARHKLSEYADMAIRTASKRAYLQGEGEKRKEWGISLVIVNKRGNPCPKCLPFCGKVLIDDVWSGGSKKDGDYPLMSKAIEHGLYHPRCKDSHTTYFPGISTADDTWTEKELEDIGLKAKEEAKQQYAKRQAEKFGRLEKYSLDEDNKKKYGVKRKQWENMADYQGIPDSWPELKINEQNIDVNPKNRGDNCVNCSIAYEMRKRNRAVFAGKSIKELRKNPFAGWVKPDIIEVDPGEGAAEYIRNAMSLWGNGSRAQIAIIYNKSSGIGHSFVVEQHNNISVFIDVQRGTRYNVDEINKLLENVEDIQFCRIDTLDINDFGANACEVMKND